MEDEDEFFDTSSLRSYSSAARRKFNDKNYMSLSRNTIYHSAVDLDMELDNLGGPANNQQNKVSDTNKTVTYSQWKNRNWRSFSKCDLCVDFVLAYNDHEHHSHQEKREVFERRLESVGLILEKETNQKINFVKIHVPKEVLSQYAEILKLRLPIREVPKEKKYTRTMFDSFVSKALDVCHVQLDKRKFPTKKIPLTAIFSQAKDYLFDIDSENFFTPSVRISVVSYILDREMFGDESHEKGIKKLIAEGAYIAAYPVHDGDISTPGSQRKLLYDEWASVSKWIKFQPIDDIKEYLGVKLALYFTWLGFYTHMLIPASLVGIICMFYGIATLGNDELSKEICNSDIMMCPLCDRNCDYWRLSDTCTYSRIVHVIDNPATIFFAVFMSFWATLYLELWKRYSAEVTHRWGLTGFDVQCEPPRPEYLTRLLKARMKENAVTKEKEPFVPFWRVRIPSIILSFTVAIFWVLLAVGVVFGIVVYRMSFLASDKLYTDKTGLNEYLMPVTAGLLNLVCIFILNYIYNYLAQKLTDMEFQRTQTQYEDSLTLKIYMFQFVNYYTCIFYIAFLKGKFVGYPAKYNRLFGYRQEECNPGGCLVELTIQLAIIMIGNQALNAFMEMIIPHLTKMYNTFKVKTGIEKEDCEDAIISCNQWTEDYKLSDLEPQGLFYEYLEMVLQYGFVTIFVTAFPLAPLFALLNNILEMRLDAKKMIKYYRRPVPRRVKGIGVWLPIMDVIGRISVVSNAFIIAFSSHFIPQMVYLYRNKAADETLSGYLNFSLAHFNTQDFVSGTAPDNSTYANMKTCRYFEYRNPPDHEMKYKRPVEYWHILAARLAFVVVYQNLVGFVISAVQWAIPDVPTKLDNQMKREAYETNEIIIKHETERCLDRIKRHQRESSVSKDSQGNNDIPTEGLNGVSSKRNSLRNSVYHDVVET